MSGPDLKTPFTAGYDNQNAQLKLAFDFILSTNQHLFLTGKAGTGKTTFLRQLKDSLPKRLVVVAPTGVAALNAGGVTIHSFFQLSFSPKIPYRYVMDKQIDHGFLPEGEKRFFRFNRQKIEIIRNMDLLIIDEISMVRADLLDGIDDVLRRFRRSDEPFGGVQLLMIGDLFQLAPVVTDDDRRTLDEYYPTHFFFGSWALKATDFVCIDLQKVYRQQDEGFISLLNKVRENCLDYDTVAKLKSRYIPDFNPNERDGYITLTTHNYQSDRINVQKLATLPGSTRMYEAVIEGDFPEYIFPTEQLIQLKVGAQVMFCKNDIGRDKQYYNGKIGTVVALKKDLVEVKCPGDDAPIIVGFEKWDNIKYEIDEETKVISEKVIGSFSQVPFKLAWAITIHKSQGLTFEKVIIDAGSAFAFGQVYVALSRCKTLEGMVLRSLITSRSLPNDKELKRFSEEQVLRSPDLSLLRKARNLYQRQILKDLLNMSEMRSKIYYLKKIASDNPESLKFTPTTVLDDLLLNINRDLYHSALTEYESIQLEWNNDRDLESETGAQQRIASVSLAIGMSLQKIVIDPLEGMEISCKNKAVNKQFRETLEKTMQLASVHKNCLQTAAEGFTVHSQLEARSQVLSGAVSPKAKLENQKISAADDHADEQIIAGLKAWRKERADKDSVPAYMVLTDQAILSLSLKAPNSLEEMMEVKGIGAKKIARYGTDLLGLLSDIKGG